MAGHIGCLPVVSGSVDKASPAEGDSAQKANIFYT